MKVLIAGGSGLIGRALTDGLVRKGHQVTILSRDPQKAQGLPESVDWIGWDAKTSQGWGQEIETVDAVVDLVGASLAGEGLFPSRWTQKRKELIISSRLNSGKALVEAISQAKRKPQVLVQSSGIGYYGFHDDEEITEDSPPGSDYLADLCVEWEDSTRPVEEMGVRRAVIRTGLVLSRQGGVIPLFRLQFGLFVGGWMGTGRQYYSWIHIADEVGAIIYLLENPEAKGTFNLTAPHPVTNRQFSKTLGKVMRRPVWLPIPGFALRLALGEVAELSLQGQRVLPHNLLKAGYAFKFTALEDAFKDLLGK